MPWFFSWELLQLRCVVGLCRGSGGARGCLGGHLLVVGGLVLRRVLLILAVPRSTRPVPATTAVRAAIRTKPGPRLPSLSALLSCCSRAPTRARPRRRRVAVARRRPPHRPRCVWPAASFARPDVLPDEERRRRVRCSRSSSASIRSSSLKKPLISMPRLSSPFCTSGSSSLSSNTTVSPFASLPTNARSMMRIVPALRGRRAPARSRL